MSTSHPVDQLFHELQKTIKVYPDSVIAVEEKQRQKKGTGFFPVYNGLWYSTPKSKRPDFPKGGIMVLGHDFGTKDYTNKKREKTGENLEGATWRNIRKVFKEAKIRQQDCFFTNSYMGLRKEGKMTGRHPSASEEEFVQQCQSFLKQQIAKQQPKLIITLGLYVPPFLAKLAQKGMKKWLSVKGVEDINNKNARHKKIRFSDPANTESTVVALLHPSMRSSNLKWRRYKRKSGAEAEKQLLLDAIKWSGIKQGEDSWNFPSFERSPAKKRILLVARVSYKETKGEGEPPCSSIWWSRSRHEQKSYNI